MTTTSDADVAAHTSPGRARLELLVVGTAALSVSLAQSLLIPVLGVLPLQIPSHPSAGTVEWLLTSTLLVGAVAVPLFGRLGDMFGKRLLLMVAVGALVLGSLVCALTSSVPVLIVGRSIQGASMAGIPLGISLMASLLPRDRVGPAIALISAMLGIGGALALPIGGLIGEHTSFHWLFWITTIVGGLSLVGIALVVPEAPNRTRGRVDLIGTVLLSAALIALLLPLAQTSSWGWGSTRTIGLLVLAAVLLGVFVLVERRIGDPLVDLAALRRRPIVLTNTASVLFGFALFAMMIGTAQYVQAPKESGYGFAASIMVSGLCMLPGGLTMLLLSNVSAGMIHRFGAPRTLALGALVIAVGWLARIVLTAHLWEVIAGTTVIGIGVALGYAAMPTLINTHTPVTELAAANGLNSLARSLGTSLASAIGGSVLAGHLVVRVIDGEQVGWSTLGSYRALFAACIVAALIAGAIALAVPRHADPDAMPEL